MRPHYVGRFAPSPTGPLHFGSLVAALASYLDARANGGQWFLRIEDVDETRCRPEFAENIMKTLHAFGFRWDGAVLVQSHRKATYQSALNTLAALGIIYACECSRKEIADSRTGAAQGIDGNVYPGTCRGRQLAFEEHTLRIQTTDRPIRVIDRLQGTIEQCLQSQLGDFIVRRRDGLFAYQLAVVVDDAMQGITDIVRGADLLDSTPRQIYLQQLLGLPQPRYLHVPVICDEDGKKLSKQNLAPGISEEASRRYLTQALKVLGQKTTGLDQSPSPEIWLERASQRWDAQKIPATRTLCGPK